MGLEALNKIPETLYRLNPWWKRSRQGFSEEEMIILRALYAGKSYAAVAERLKCSERTARRYAEPILKKIGAGNIKEALEILNRTDPPQGFPF